MKTSHWGQISSAAILVANGVLGQVCGHSIDVTAISWVGVVTSQAISWADWIQRHLRNGNNPGTDISQVQI